MLDRLRLNALWRGAKPQPVADPPAETTRDRAPSPPRNRQKNLKASAECIAAFAQLAKASGMSEAALFEDMVAERWEKHSRVRRTHPS